MKKFLKIAFLCSVAFVTLNVSATIQTHPVPDTGSTMVLLAAALGGLVLLRRK
jgi:hypothetical protein